MSDSVRDLSASRILNGLVNTRFRSVEVHDELPSTQTLLVEEGGPDGRVVIANHQTAGRGRAGRTWLDVPNAMLMFSALIAGVGPERAPLISLAAGVAVARAIGPVARLKWPNDVRIGGRKVCGILSELAGGAEYVAVGIGVNVGHRPGDLPADVDATSLAIEDEAPRRDDLCVAILREVDTLVGSEFLDEYRSLCETIGAKVRVELSGDVFEGDATSLDDDGALVVSGRRVVAGDVIHVR